MTDAKAEFPVQTGQSHGHTGGDVDLRVRAERRSIGKQLHQGILQELTIAGLRLQVLQQTAPEPVVTAIAEFAAWLRDRQADLRLVVSELEQGRPAASTVVLETIAADLRERYGCAMTFDLKVPPSDFEPGIWSAMIETSGGLAQMLADIFAARRLHIGLLADSKPILHVSHDGQRVADNAELLAAARALVGRGGASLKIDSQSGAERLTLDWTS